MNLFFIVSPSSTLLYLSCAYWYSTPVFTSSITCFLNSLARFVFSICVLLFLLHLLFYLLTLLLFFFIPLNLLSLLFFFSLPLFFVLFVLLLCPSFNFLLLLFLLCLLFLGFIVSSVFFFSSVLLLYPFPLLPMFRLLITSLSPFTWLCLRLPTRTFLGYASPVL